VISWNIRAGGGRRVDRIAAQVADWGADVVALSEFRATPPSERLRQGLAGDGLRFQVSTADASLPASNRLLVASRWPVCAVRQRAAPREPGRWCLADIAAPRPFLLGVMHVPNRVSGRKDAYLAATLKVARSWRRGPALLIGDTNSGRIGIDEEVPVFDRREDGWIAALEEAGWRDAFRHLHGERRAYTWYSPNGGNGFRIDQAFVHRSLLPRLIDARYDWARARSGEDAERRDAISDHAAIIVELEA
jgi:endonuclease/exonuclease/phosphatase family metal-dependent hydrolase